VRHYTLREDAKVVNDTYVNRYYTIDVYVSSKTSNAQLKLLYDEVEYLLRNTTMTDLQLVKITKDWSGMLWEFGKHSIILRVELVSLMSDGAITPATGASTDFAVGGDMTVGGELTVGGHITLDAETDIIIADDTDKVFQIREGNNTYLCVSTTNGTEVISMGCGGTLVGTWSTTGLEMASGKDISFADGGAVAEALMLGSANAAWIPMNFMGAEDFTEIKITSAGLISTTGASNTWYLFSLPMPTNKGSLKLYISNLKIGVYDADGAAFITTVNIRAFSGYTPSQLDTDGTNHSSQGDKTFSGAVMPASAIDCSAYDSIYVACQVGVDAANELDFGNVRMECYYDT